MTTTTLSSDRYSDVGIDVLFTDDVRTLQKFALHYCEQFADLLEEDECVLYLNCITSTSRLVRDLNPIRRRNGGNWFRAETFRSGDIAQSTGVIETAIKVYHARLLVINCLEFAALSSYHKAKLILWLRTVRDHHDCHVLLLMTRKPSAYGSERVLALWASEILDISKDVARLAPPLTDSMQPQSAEAETADQHPASEEISVEVPAQVEVNVDEIPIESDPELQDGSLKTNDLQGEILNSPEKGGLRMLDWDVFIDDLAQRRAAHGELMTSDKRMPMKHGHA